MADRQEEHQDAITEEEISGTAISANDEASSNSPSPKASIRNAFTELMARKPHPKPPAAAASSTTHFWGRDGLGAYTHSPTSFPPSRVIYHTPTSVVINDMYPKSSIHILLLPRDSTRNLLHPFEAFEDPVFLSSVQQEVRELRHLVATELRRKYGRFSTQDRAREEALETDSPPPELPPGRDWEKDVISGIHAHPSMNHLHVHVLSVDRVSDCMRHLKHYNSFATPFLIDVDDFPLPPDDVRRHPGREGYLTSDLKCWRCGKNFGKQFAKLKRHLADELEEWKRE
ncbi:MAG: hypothetical protein M1819_006994 [Sarea resinae]|nr:MAG: hypothetical protein M1819_006994 [Sarea resinae]